MLDLMRINSRVIACLEVVLGLPFLIEVHSPFVWFKVMQSYVQNDLLNKLLSVSADVDIVFMA